MNHRIYFNKQGKPYSTRVFRAADLSALLAYLHQLSPETKQRFGPHDYDETTVAAALEDERNTGYVSFDISNTNVIAYTLIRRGFLEHDQPRFSSNYQLSLDAETDSTVAPSVADAWQGTGVGKQVLETIVADLKKKGCKRLLLWGGVQLNNERAVAFYQSMGFRTLGNFEHHGWNQDMLLDMQ